jgi:cation:H+ antiporter
MLAYILFVIGFVFLIKGADFLVEGSVSIARRLNVSDLVIGLTVAAYKRKADIAVGNVVGSNIFNIFFVLGISATIKPLPFQTKNNIDLGMVILSSLMLFFFMFTGKKRSLDRWEGIVCLILYFGYIAFLIVNE